MSEKNTEPVNSVIIGKVDPNSAKIQIDPNIPMLLKLLQDQENNKAALQKHLTATNTQYARLFENCSVLNGFFNKCQQTEAAKTREIAILKKRITELEVENDALKSDKGRACLWFLNKA